MEMYNKLGIIPVSRRVVLMGENINQKDVHDDFLRCVVRYCTEEVEFVVDGMRFKATCERVD